MFGWVFRLQVVMCVAMVTALVTARLAGEARPRDWLAFPVGQDTAIKDIYILDVPLRLLVNLSAALPDQSPEAICDEQEPAWSSDGRLAFSQYCIYHSGQIVVVDFANMRVQGFAHDAELDEYPTWTPDNRLTFLTIFRASARSITQMLDPLTGEMQPVEGVYTTNPVSWSDDGKLVFESSSRIYIHDGETNPTTFTPDEVYDGRSAWSPDGKQIAFNRSSRGNQDVFVFDLPTRTTRRIRLDGLEGPPTWSPDGLLTFASLRSSEAGIYTLDQSTWRTFILVEKPAWSPAWSPSGSHLAFLSNRDGHRRLYLMDHASRRIVNLTPTLDDVGTPVWAR
jgi:Tol biopolymer transport system component